MRDRFPLLLVGGLLLLAVLGYFLFKGGARGSFADKLSTYRSEKDGARGLYLLAPERGVQGARKQLDMRTLVPAQPTPFTLGVERVEAKVQSYLELPQDAVPILVDDKLGAPVAGVVPYGQGQLIVIGSPELAENVALARADNAQF